MEGGTAVEDGAKEILLLLFGDELEVCPRCGERHLLPPWGSRSPGDRICVSCGIISATAKIDAA
jgi:hypothetical protein